MPRVIGLTGLMGSGKTSLAHLFSLKNYHIIDVDLVGKILLQEPQTKSDLRSLFGESIFGSKGDIIPSELGNIVFNNKEALLQLNEYMHPKMRTIIKEEINNSLARNILIHAALLFQMELQTLCHLIILISVEEEILIDRIIQRKSYLTKKSILGVLENQKYSNNFFQSADIIIDNSQNEQELTRKFERLYSQFKEK